MFARLANRKALLTLTGAATSVILMSGSAQADRRNPAPIVYGGQASAAEQAEARPSQPAISTVPDAGAGRIAFRYPGAEAQAASAEPTQRYAALPTKPSETANRVSSNPYEKPADLTKATAQPVSRPIRISAEPTAKAGPVGRPISLSRVRADQAVPTSEEFGLAGVYTEGFDGQPTANGELFDSQAMTAAHPNLPLPSLVQVTNQTNGREIVVRVNDRGPFAGGRIIDLSERAAGSLGLQEGQTANVRIRYLGPAPVSRVADADVQPAVREEAMPAFQTAKPVQVAEYPATSVRAQTALTARATPAVRSAPQKPVANGNVFIQAGSFSDIGNAQRLTDALGRRLPVEIQQARVRGADYFRVMIGPFSTRQQAETYRAHLAEQGITQGFLVEK